MDGLIILGMVVFAGFACFVAVAAWIGQGVKAWLAQRATRQRVKAAMTAKPPPRSPHAVYNSAELGGDRSRR